MTMIQPEPGLSGERAEIDLLVGESPYVPGPLLEELVTRVRASETGQRECHRYADPRGTEALRQEIALRYRRLYGVTVDPDREILVTQGATEAVWLSVFALTRPGDEVVVPDPGYLAFEPVIRSLGRRPVRVPVSPRHGYTLAPHDLEKRAGERTKMLILASPDNPTGVVYRRGQLEALHAVVAARGISVVHDEVYDSFVYDGEHVSAATLGETGAVTVIVNSLSKRFGIGGWRLGWMITSPARIDAAARAHTNMNMASSTLLQEAVAPVLNDSRIEAEVAVVATRLRAGRDLLVDALLDIDGVECPFGRPASGFYVFADVFGLWRRLGCPTGYRSVGEAVTAVLGERCALRVGPGASFGPSGDGCVRISFVATADVLTEAARRIALLGRKNPAVV